MGGLHNFLPPSRKQRAFWICLVGRGPGFKTVALLPAATFLLFMAFLGFHLLEILLLGKSSAADTRSEHSSGPTKKPGRTSVTPPSKGRVLLLPCHRRHSVRLSGHMHYDPFRTISRSRLRSRWSCSAATSYAFLRMGAGKERGWESGVVSPRWRNCWLADSLK
jgi:hypothetical protein